MNIDIIFKNFLTISSIGHSSFSFKINFLSKTPSKADLDAKDAERSKRLEEKKKARDAEIEKKKKEKERKAEEVRRKKEAIDAKHAAKVNI